MEVHDDVCAECNCGAGDAEGNRQPYDPVESPFLFCLLTAVAQMLWIKKTPATIITTQVTP